MARRRNTPALFELLRDSNSTPKGQVGNPALREQIGAGTVENSAPRTPRPPDPASQDHPAGQDKAGPTDSTKVAREALVESKPTDSKTDSTRAGQKTPTTLIIEDPAPEPTLLSEIPRFQGQRVAASASEPQPRPEPKTKAEPKVKAKAAPKAKTTAAATKEPVTPMESKSARSKPNAPAPAKPGATDSASEAGGDHVKPGQVTLSVSTIWMVFAAIVVVLVLVWVIAVQTGRQQSTDRLAAASSDAAKSALKDAGVTEPRIVDPLAIASDPEFSSPTIEPNTSAPSAPESAEVEQATPQATQTSPEEQLPNKDVRRPGFNYLHLAALSDPEEARRLRIFLHEHGIESYVREGTKGGRPVYEIITLVGVPSKGYSTSTVKLEHEREIQRLGGLWYKEHGGSIDYSRSNQWQWYKMPASAGSE